MKKMNIYPEILNAFVTDDFQAMKKLILSGTMDINAADPRRKCLSSPLMRASMSDDNKEFVDWLIKNSANINQKDGMGWTALHFSCEYGCKQNTKLLLQSGAFVNHQDNSGATPLLRLFAQNISENIFLAKILIENGSDPDIKNNSGISPKDINQKLINTLISDCF